MNTLWPQHDNRSYLEEAAAHEQTRHQLLQCEVELNNTRTLNNNIQENYTLQVNENGELRQQLNAAINREHAKAAALEVAEKKLEKSTKTQIELAEGLARLAARQ